MSALQASHRFPNTSWNAAIAEAINKAHFEIDCIDGNFDLATDGGAASFATKLATMEGRAMLADALSYDLPVLTQVIAPSTTAQFKDDILQSISPAGLHPIAVLRGSSMSCV